MSTDNSNQIDAKLLWAFAVDTTKPTRPVVSKHRLPAPRRNLQRYAITVASPRLREFGVRAGMRYNEAKALVPNMRIIVFNR